MSAPPPGPGAPNGQPRSNQPGVPGGPPKRIVRRKPQDNPFARKPPKPRPPPSRPPKKPDAQSDEKDAQPVFDSSRFQPSLDALEERRKQNGGWTERPASAGPNVVQEFPLVTTKRALLEGIRYHVMRFNRPKDETVEIDPTNPEQFPRPVSLHRRDPRLPPVGKMIVKDESATTMTPANPVDEAEVERLRQQKADREAQRALEQAQIAPILKPNEPKPKQVKKEKAQGYYGKQTEAQKKQSGLRYEETLPWHLEDAEGKQVWVGSYIAGLSELNCALVIDGSGFRMIPLERFYKFDEKPIFNTMSLDEAERLMKDKVKPVGRWLMKDREDAAAKKEKEDYRTYLRGRPRVKAESSTSRSAPKSERRDDFDVDVEGDEFQDDDETAGFEADDEDVKDAKDRVRREHLGANLFGDGDEDEVEKEHEEEEKEKLQRKQLGKQTVKGLTKHEHALDYAGTTDSEDADNNPFTESSDSESDSDAEKKDEAKQEDAKKPETKDLPASGSSAKGSSTPSGSKKAAPVAGAPGTTAADSLKKGKSLKRPGSPGLSESSGNESSRNKKKAKTGGSGGVKGPSSLVTSRSTTPLPARPKGPGSAVSDGEGTANEGSDGGLKAKKPKVKLTMGSTGTPGGSRAGSPTPSGTTSVSPNKPPTSSQGGSQPGPGAGPASPSAASTAAAAAAAGRVQAQEIIQALEAQDGISIGSLMRIFQHRVNQPGGMTKSEWLQLVKQNSIYGSDKLLRPKARSSA